MGIDFKPSDLPRIARELVIEMIFYIPAFFILIYMQNTAFIIDAVTSINAKSFLLVSLLIVLPITFYFYNMFLMILITGLAHIVIRDENNTIIFLIPIVTILSLSILIIVRYFNEISTNWLLIFFGLCPLILHSIIIILGKKGNAFK